MIWTVCGLKPGVGTSVVTAAIALIAASDLRVVIVDLFGDQSALLPGTPSVTATADGMLNWLASEAEDDSLSQLLIQVRENAQLLPAGTLLGPDVAELSTGPIRHRFLQASSWLLSQADLVIVDAGPLPRPGGLAEFIMASSDRRTMVVSPCYLALGRAASVSLEMHDLVEVSEPGRALRAVDIEGIFQHPVDVRIRKDPAVARSVDAGTLSRRLPRSLTGLKRLHRAAAELPGPVRL